MSIFVCPLCSKHIDTDFHSEDIYDDGENDPVCQDCEDNRIQAMYNYWYPLYKGEVQAGLVGYKS
jgi:hypothetical protein